MYIVTIPVKPYVRKYILARYKDTMWRLSKQDRIGKFIYVALDRIPKRLEKINLNYGAELKIEISSYDATHKGIYLSSESIREFNEFIQEQLVEDIAMYIWNVKNRTGLKKYEELYIKYKFAKKVRTRVVKDPDLFQYLEQKEIIYDILKLYDITEDDFPYDSLKKCLQRLKLPLLMAS